MPSRIVFINGGTGFIGKALCSDFLSRPCEDTHQTAVGSGAKLYVQTRHPNQHRHQSITFVSSYQNLPDDVVPDTIINLAGAPIAEGRWTDRRKRIIRNSRVLLTDNLLNSVIQKGHTPEVLINASAVGFYGNCGDFCVDEDHSKGTGFAADLCADWEASAQSFNRLGTRVCILRIGIVLGLGGGALAKLLPIFKLGLGGPIGDGEQWFSWVHKTDLLRLITTMLGNARYSGVYNATAPNPVKQKDFAKALGRELRRPAVLPTPSWLLTAIYGEMAKELLVEGQRVMPVKAEKDAFKFDYPQLDLALRDILRH